PQVVSQPLAQKMSFWAMGMPVSGYPPPPARRRSAASACFKLASSPSVMKQLSFPFNELIVLRKCRVSSTLEMRRAARSVARRLIVAWCIAARSRTGASGTHRRVLLDHLGHQVEAVIHLRGDRLEQGALVGLRGGVRAQALHHVERMGHRLDVAGIHRL